MLNSVLKGPGNTLIPMSVRINGLYISTIKINGVYFSNNDQWLYINTYEWIEPKGMTLNHDFGYNFPFLFPPKKRGKKKRRMYSQNRVFKPCLSA